MTGALFGSDDSPRRFHHTLLEHPDMLAQAVANDMFAEPFMKLAQDSQDEVMGVVDELKNKGVVQFEVGWMRYCPTAAETVEFLVEKLDEWREEAEGQDRERFERMQERDAARADLADLQGKVDWAFKGIGAALSVNRTGEE